MDDVSVASQLRALHPRCFGWALTCCGDRREDAEDVLHDVYVRVLENGARFDGRSTFRTWLFGLIRNTARARRRRERLHWLLGLRHATRIDAPSPAVPPDEDAASAERRDRTRTALARLAPRQREVLMLVFYHDLTVDEAASVMGVSPGAARVHYDRGKKRMAMMLAGDRP